MTYGNSQIVETVRFDVQKKVLKNLVKNIRISQFGEFFMRHPGNTRKGGIFPIFSQMRGLNYWTGLPTIKDEFNKRNFSVRSLFNYVFFCFYTTFHCAVL